MKSSNKLLVTKPMIKRPALTGLIAVGVVVAACGGGEATVTTSGNPTTTAAELATTTTTVPPTTTTSRASVSSYYEEDDYASATSTSRPSSSTSTPAPTTTAPPPTTAPPAATTAPPAAGQTVTIGAENFAFSPANVTIKIGDTVQWLIRDGSHTTTSGANSTLDGGWNQVITAEVPVSVTFDTAGEFPFFCRFHPDAMQGSVVVEP